MLVERGQCLSCRKSQTEPPIELSRDSATESGSSSSLASSKSVLEVLGDFTFHMDREARPVRVSGSRDNPNPIPTHCLASHPPGDDDSLRVISQPLPWIPAGTAVYQGPYNDCGQRHGEGEMIWSNGDVYRGAFVCDFRQGHGTISFANAPQHSTPSSTQQQQQQPQPLPSDGGEYVGDWSQDQMHGSGTRRFPNGDVYMGEYNRGFRHGQGRFYYANGDLYWGAWQNNQMHGPGRYYYASGQRFEGTFGHGKRTGKGKLQRTDGMLEIFQYVNDQRVGQGVRWSADRSRAWRLWIPSSSSSSSTNRALVSGLQKQSMTVAEAVSLVYDIEQGAEYSKDSSLN
jgi:hypothetical protein